MRRGDGIDLTGRRVAEERYLGTADGVRRKKLCFALMVVARNRSYFEWPSCVVKSEGEAP
jgi:hypothetical protein